MVLALFLLEFHNRLYKDNIVFSIGVDLFPLDEANEANEAVTQIYRPVKLKIWPLVRRTRAFFIRLHFIHVSENRLRVMLYWIFKLSKLQTFSSLVNL